MEGACTEATRTEEQGRHPNIPLTPIASHPSLRLVGWAWGRRLFIFDTVSGSLVFESDPAGGVIIGLAASEECWVVTTDDKQLIVFRHEVDAGIIKKVHVFHLRRRVMATVLVDRQYRGDDTRLVIADKFGDVQDTTFGKLHLDSEATLGQKAAHMKRNPGDKSIQAMNEKRLADSGPGLEVALDDIPQSFCGHLASITQMRLVELKSPVLSRSVQLIVTCDRDEKVRLSRYPDLHIVEAILCGHLEVILDVHLLPGDIPRLLSISGDKTVRVWDIATASEIGRVDLPDVPFAMIVSQQGSALVAAAASKQLFTVRWNERDRKLEMSSRLLPAEPLAIVGIVHKEKFVWLDPEGNLRSGNLRLGQDDDYQDDDYQDDDYQVLLSGASYTRDDVALFQRPWKHTREEGAPTVEERLAKRLRHSRD